MAERQTATDRSQRHLRVEAELGIRRAAGPPTPHDDGELEFCPCCGRDLVHPLDWTPAGRDHWAVTLRCPECEWRGGGIYQQDVLDRFDEILDDGVQAVLDDLEALTRANLEDEIERFAAALESDLVLPEDF